MTHANTHASLCHACTQVFCTILAGCTGSFLFICEPWVSPNAEGGCLCLLVVCGDPTLVSGCSVLCSKAVALLLEGTLLSCAALTFWQHSVLQYLCSAASFCLFSSIIFFPTSSILLCSPAEKQPYAFPVKLESMAVSKALRAAEQPTLRRDTIPNISTFHLGGVGVSRDCPTAASSVLQPHATH